MSSSDYGDSEKGDRSVYIYCNPATEELFDKYVAMAGFTKELNEVDEIVQLEDKDVDFLQISYTDEPPRKAS